MIGGRHVPTAKTAAADYSMGSGSTQGEPLDTDAFWRGGGRSMDGFLDFTNLLKFDFLFLWFCETFSVYFRLYNGEPFQSHG